MLTNLASLSKELDIFALAASQHHNLGNAGNWFFSYRGGYQGTISRVNGLHFHSFCLHKWEGLQIPPNHEHHVATMLFCMDSAIECFVFMLNALGQAADPASFRDVSSDAALRAISPADILGGKRNTPLAGYAVHTPSLQNYWQQEATLIRLITENHDVTKHRQAAGLSGRFRMDPPINFHRSRGLSDDLVSKAIFSPMEYVNLNTNPKMPLDARANTPAKLVKLEDLERDFLLFLENSFALALTDSRKHILLNDSTLHK